MAEKESEVTERGDEWGVRACEGIARLNGSLEGLTSMIGRQNELLVHLLDMMAEERGWTAWRRMERAPRTAPIVLGVGEEEEVREEVKEKGDEEDEDE